jgi:hypothetical protein
MERPIQSGYEREASDEMDLLVTLENLLNRIDTLWGEFITARSRAQPDIRGLASQLHEAYDSLQEVCGFTPGGHVPVRNGNAILGDTLNQTILDQAGDQVKADELTSRVAHELASYRQHLGRMLD